MILGSSDSTQSGAVADAARSATDKAKLDEDLNKFLNLLVTQLKNQDPLDPMDAGEFTSQLVQFASVEQQIYQNSNLEKLVDIQKATQVSSLVNYLNTIIESAGDTINYESGNARFTYDLPDKAALNTISILDAADKVVFSTQGNLDAGHHLFTWDGKDMGGVAVDPGAYTISISALDVNKDEMKVQQTVYGRVTSAGAKDGAITLFMGDVSAPLGNVISVEENPVP